MAELPSIVVRVRTHINPLNLRSSEETADDNTGVTTLKEDPTLLRVRSLPGSLQFLLNQLCTSGAYKGHVEFVMQPDEWIVGFVPMIEPSEEDMRLLLTAVRDHAELAHVSSRLDTQFRVV